MKKIISHIIIVFLLLISLAPSLTFAQQKKINIYFFYSETCPHCKEEEPFLSKLEKNDKSIDLHYFEITKIKENRDLLKKVAQKLSTKASGVPFTVIGDEYIVGWMDENSTGAQIENAIDNARFSTYDIFDEMKNEEIEKNKNENENKIIKTPHDSIKVPILGTIKLKNLSLPTITLIIGAIDGFNPCAMWILLFLISFLMGVESKKKRWLIGGFFIFSSALAYFLFMAAWLNLFIFLGFIVIVRWAIGGISIAGGIFNIKKYKEEKNKEDGCEIIEEEKRKNLISKLKKITKSDKLIVSLIGVFLLAFSVNLIELICSAGLPAVYTQILALNNVPTWQYYAYILLYILIFMLDDMIVFVVAMLTMEITGVTTKYVKFSHLVGGIAMLIIGLLLIFKPELLFFG